MDESWCGNCRFFPSLIASRLPPLLFIVCSIDVIRSPSQDKPLAAIGIANQRETTVAWDKTSGQPLARALVWFDARTAGVVRDLTGPNNDKDRFRSVTGLPISTYFSGSKMKWLLENDENVKKAATTNTLCLGTIDCWLTYNLTGAFVTDVSNASRYNLMDLASRKWSDPVLKECGISAAWLPEIVRNVEGEKFGICDVGAFLGDAELGAFGKVPVLCSLGDQHAALVGQGCFAPGEAKNTYGTGRVRALRSWGWENNQHVLFTGARTMVVPTEVLFRGVGCRIVVLRGPPAVSPAVPVLDNSFPTLRRTQNPTVLDISIPIFVGG